MMNRSYPLVAGASLASTLHPRFDAPSPRGFLFELRNVIYDDTTWERWLWKLTARLGVERAFSSFRMRWERSYLRDVCSGHRQFCDAFRGYMSELGLTAGQTDEVEAAGTSRRNELGEIVRPLPGVVRTFNQLASAGISFGIIANCELSKSNLQQFVSRLGILSKIGCLVSSFDLKCAMPEAGCYQAALSQLQLRPDDVTFVGSSADNLAGAARLGLSTIAVNFEPDAMADGYLRRIDELLNFYLPVAA